MSDEPPTDEPAGDEPAGDGTGGDRPVVAVVVAEGEGVPPGLGAVEAAAELHAVHDASELEGVLDRVEVLVVDDFRTDLLEGIVPRAPRLRWIHTSSAGVDALLGAGFEERDVLVTNAQGVFDRGIAEWVLAVVLVFAKDLHTTFRLQQRAEWRHRESRLVEGSRMLVVGAGSIGHSIAELARAAGLELRGVARSERTDDPVFGRVAPAGELHEHLAWADFVVVSTPLTEETRGMIGPDELAAMPERSYLVNVARGPVVQERALLHALRAREIAGAALDVFDVEPLPAQHPLWGRVNVIVSPHMSGDFEGWREALGALVGDNFERWQRGEELRNRVDTRRLAAAGAGS